MTIIISSGVHSGNVTYNGVVDVLQGGSVASLTLTSGGTADVAGVVGAATISGGAIVSVTNGGTISNATVMSGGAQDVLDGGAASRTVVQAGGTETVASGGLTESGLVSSGGTEVFAAGAQLLHETVMAGGTLVESGLTLANSMTLSAPVLGETLNIIGTQLAGVAATRGLTIEAGGVLSVTALTSDSGTTIASGGKLFQANGTVLGDTIASGGTVTVSSGLISGTMVAGTLDIVGDSVDSGSIVSGSGASETGSGVLLPVTMIPRLDGDTIEVGGHLFVGYLAVASGTDVAGGGTADVMNGGDLTAATVGGGGFVNVSSGGTAVGTTVSSGGVLYASAVGKASATTVLSGGNEVAMAGGSSIQAVVDSGGTAAVLNGGFSDLATVSAGGILAFVVGASLNEDTLLAGATLSENGVVLSAGMSMIDSAITAASAVEFALGNQVLTGVVETVFASVGNGARLTVAAGGTDLDGTVSAGGTMTVAGGLASNTTVNGGALVVSGGTVTGAVVSGGGAQISGGIISAATILAGSLTILAGGNAASTTVTGAGQEVVSGHTKYDTASAGGVILVASHGLAENVTIQDGGSMTVLAQGNLAGVVIDSGGSAKLLSGAIAQGNATLDGGSLSLGDTGGGFNSVVFSGSGGILVNSASLSVPFPIISGFGAGDTIDLASVAFVSAATIGPVSTNVLNVVQGSVDFRIAFQPTIAGDSFALSNDGTGGTDVTMTVLCFLQGTRIAIPDGEIAVERLRPGDTVRLAGGGTAPVAWLGRRMVDLGRHPRPEAVRPVRVRAGAFGPGLPARDLFLSPDHAVYADGVLIPVRYLLNGGSIAQQAGLSRATYWHIELAAHDVVLAEGLPCETYLDAGNRAAFDNAGTVTWLHPDFSQRLWDADACAPLVVTGPRLARVRAMLRSVARSAGADLGEAGVAATGAG